MSSEWSTPTAHDEVCRRAAGRRNYNAVRKLKAALRLKEIMDRISKLPGSMLDWGVQARLARELDVSKSTISRDFAKILEMFRAA